jgi:hypothetical protein
VPVLPVEAQQAPFGAEEQRQVRREAEGQARHAQGDRAMTDNERGLLLTVARLLRAHMADHMNHPDFSDIHLDFCALNDALAPFDPSPAQQKVVDMMNDKTASERR